MNGDTADIIWEEDPNILIYNEETPGQHKMHVRMLDLKDWVKIDKTYPDQMQLKRDILLSKAKIEDVFVSKKDESATLCKWELFDLLVKHLPKRFPAIFELRNGGIYNKVTKELISTQRDDPEDPLIRASRLTQEDWCIIEWSDKEEGYVLTSGIVYFPMRWSLKDKFNKVVKSVHEPVDAFQKHLLNKVNTLFKKMKPEAPIWRANWAVFNDLEGPLDLYTPTGSLTRNEVNKHTQFVGEQTGRELTFRAEYQTLRKLPETKCIVFSIRTYQRYLEDFKNFPLSDVEGLIRSIKNLDKDMSNYKGAEFWQKAALEYLHFIIAGRNKGLQIRERLRAYIPLLLAVTVGLVAIFFVMLQFSDSFARILM